MIKVTCKQTGESLKTDAAGMREMQRRAYKARNDQYILIKAPPASGKSRALMFLGLDKLHRQGIKKVIVAVPQRTIAKSFAPVKLTETGFFADWNFPEKYDLCGVGDEKGKIATFKKFINDPNANILLCTHATFLFAFEDLDSNAFNNILVAIDEFHHSSADADSRLGEAVRKIMGKTNAHIIAMTGSYFRGNCVPVMRSEDEAKFTKINYDYYEQLNGYTYLESLGIGYHFYQGKYLSAIGEVLDTNKKTIIHIPHVGSGESTKDKDQEVNDIIGEIGTAKPPDPDTGVIFVERHGDKKILKIADLVYDDTKERDKIVSYLRNMQDIDDIDIIIALGMAKEGFDWPFCEHALTVGFRASMTEIIQIIGRATRDSENKTHAQFTNLVAQPDATGRAVKVGVNNMLKAISASLLMEQVLAPNFKFKLKKSDSDGERVVRIKGFKEATTSRAKQIIDTDLDDLITKILQDPKTLQSLLCKYIDAETINKVLIPKVIHKNYQDISKEEIEQVRQYVVADAVIKNSKIEQKGNKRFVQMGDKFVNIEDLHIDLIDRVKPFQKAFEILSKQLTEKRFKAIRDMINALRIEMTDEDAIRLYHEAGQFKKDYDRLPSINSRDPKEKRMAEALIYCSKNNIMPDDPLNLLQAVKKFSGQKTETERLVGAFEEVNEFFAKHKRAPKKSKDDIIEFTLACRLQAIQSNADKLAAIGKHDKHNLLAEQVAEQSIEEILADGHTWLA